jgi:two-component system, NarL family, response regulator NreC
MTTAALVDDHPVFRQGLKLLFELHGDPRVVAETSLPQEAVEMVRNTRPDVVLLDLIFPDGVSGVSVAHQLLRSNPAERILFVSMVKDDVRVADALESGALGYATKDQSAEELVEAVQTVAAGRSYLAATLPSERIEAQRKALRENARLGNLASLTGRERQIFDMTVAGLTAAGIGEKLSISRRTVETHRARILSKLGVHSAAELVRIAARAGML